MYLFPEPQADPTDLSLASYVVFHYRIYLKKKKEFSFPCITVLGFLFNLGYSSFDTPNSKNLQAFAEGLEPCGIHKHSDMKFSVPENIQYIICNMTQCV